MVNEIECRVMPIGEMEKMRPAVDAPGYIAGVCRRAKVAIGHPFLGRGGSESTVMWLIEALKPGCDITVITTGGWDLAELNMYYGTRVREEEVRVRIAPVPFPLQGLSAAAFRAACYQRYAREVAAEYDVRLSAYNLTDWGLPAIHFIADFSWHLEIRNRIDPPSPGLIYKDSALRKAYLGISAAYANPSGRDLLRQDRLIANSMWTAELIRQVCHVDSTAVVYPCVWTEFPKTAWEDKEDAFVMIGRVTPEKQVERAIAILRLVRDRGYAIRLHLCGHIDNDLYGRKIAMLCREHSDWIIPEGFVSGARKTQILSRCRFGIHTRGAEPFGISVAEMVQAGAIVFAPDRGGQVEILDHNDLLFQTMDDAVDKICAVLSSTEKQASLRNHLAKNAGIFRAENFMRESLEAIAVHNVGSVR
jgi:glycosyltransferase involved in cell wall biosynthesis